MSDFNKNMLGGLLIKSACKDVFKDGKLISRVINGINIPTLKT